MRMERIGSMRCGAFVRAALIFIMAAVALSSCAAVSDAGVINANWGIGLPSGARCVYSMEEEDNWFGEGDRYHVFELDSVDGIAEQDGGFSVGTSSEAEEFVSDIASSLGVEDEFLPAFGSEYKYLFTKSPEGDDTLALIYSSGRLYVAERFT